MKMKLLFVNLFLTALVLGAYKDTGMRTWRQPNGATFMARMWGDEFINQMEMKTGHKIKLGSDGYYYYAVLDNAGDFAQSRLRVGIDEALSASYHLERTQGRIKELEKFAAQQNQNYFNNYHTTGIISGRSAKKSTDIIVQSATTVTNAKLGIVLIDFTPSARGTHYFKSNYDYLFFSSEYYYGFGKHPDGDEVFGSFRDYYKNQSLNNIDIVGKDGGTEIINPLVNGTSEPQWVILPYSKSYYATFDDQAGFLSTCMGAAQSQLGFVSSNYNVVGFVYAGNLQGGNLWPNGSGGRFCVSELENSKFFHFGTAAHEFAHQYLGAWDEYKGSIDTYGWSLMATGNDNGPNNLGACPAPFSPGYRIMNGWVTPIDITSNTQNLNIQYNSTSPNFYRVSIPGSNDYYIIERRQKDNFDLYTPDYENGVAPDGILIWHFAPDYLSANSDFEKLLGANGDVIHIDWQDRFPYPQNSVQSISDGTSPSIKKRNGGNSYVTISNIERISGHGEVDVTIYDNYTQNTTISSSTTLSRHQKVNNNINLTIASGATLTIPEGITFLMGSGSNIVSNGRISATGTSSNKVQFLPTTGSSPGSWGYLKFDGSGASSSVLDHINMSYGREIQCFNGANITIQNSTISGNQNGIYCDYSSSPTIQDNTIQNVQYHSIISFNASAPRILHNELRKDTGPYYHNSTGLWLIGSSPYIATNTIRGMGFGVYATWSSNPQFTPSPNLNIPTPYPNNYITDNNCGVVAYETSYPVMGYEDPPDPMVGGNNSLKGEPYDVAVSDGCGVLAEYNWWGGDYTPSYQLGEEAWLDYSSPLQTDPFEEDRADHNPVKRSSSISLPANLTALSQGPSLHNKENEDILIRALSLRRHKRFNEAAAIYKQLLAVKGHSQTALSWLADMFRENKDNSILEYFQGLRSNPESYPSAQQDWAKISGLLASMHIQRGEYSTAKQVYDEIITQRPGTSDDRHAKFQKFLLALHIDKDRDAAALVLNDLASKFSDGQEVEFAEYLLNGAGTSEKSGSDGQSPMSRKSKKNGIPEKFELSANYPNPFNPSTTIQYAIPQNSYVTLKVFDVLGKEIAALVNEEKAVGFYDVRFDASHISSGIYFYQIQAGSFRSTKKMILTK